MTTFQKLQIKLAGSRFGRVALHLICFCQDGKLRWHARGMARELAPLPRHLLRAIRHSASQVADMSVATQTVSAIHDTVLMRKQVSHAA